MTSEANSTFVYVTYIGAAPEKLWTALTSDEFTKQYFFGMRHETDWKPGSPWRLVSPDGRIANSGEILEVEPLKRIVIKWRKELQPEAKAEGYSRCTIELEPVADAVKLTVVHTIDAPESKLIAGVSEGWPRILSNLKSLLETGEVVLKG